MDCGMEAFTDRSSRRIRLANQLPLQVENLILQVKKEFPHWGEATLRQAVADSEGFSNFFTSR